MPEMIVWRRWIRFLFRSIETCRTANLASLGGLRNKRIGVNLAGLLLLTACGEPLPEHVVEKSSLGPRMGDRVQINVVGEATKAQCLALIEEYRSDGAPDGQVVVTKRSAKLNYRKAPWCIENFDGAGVNFNDFYFE